MKYLDSHEVLATQDLHQMQEILTDLTNPMDIDVIGKNQEIDASLRSVECSGLELMHATYGDVRTSVRTYEVDNAELLFFILTDGSANIKHNGKDFDISKTTALMRDSRLPLLARQEDFSSFAMPLSIDTLQAHIATLLGEEYCGLDITFDPEIDLTTPTGRHLHNTVHYFADALNGPLNGGGNPIIFDGLKDLLLTSVLSLLPNSCSDMLGDQPASKILPRHVKRARDYIHAHAASSITLETLATHAGCGYRTLQVGFNDAFDMSPMAYIKYVRLTFAHADLRCANDGVTVRDIALKWGFCNMSWFSKNYLEQFGALPSQTLRTRS